MSQTNMDKRRMCSNCRAFITTDDRVCPYCQTEVGPRAIDRQGAADAMAGLIQGDRFITTLILLINVGFYVATLLMFTDGRKISMDPSFDALLAFGGKRADAIIGAGQWWRLITAGFLHGGILHIGMNMWVLYDLGPQIDEVFGAFRYLTIYFVATVAGFGASLYWAPFVLSIGASAGIAGLVGAMVGLGTREKHSVIGANRGRYVQWMLFILVQGFIISGIDNAAHIGGFLGGFVIAYLAGSKGHARGEDFVWRTAAYVSLAVTAYAFFRMFQWLFR
ncbi:MAG: rhomboid family intramembrane serine protease [Acidobacteriota bacterium]